MPEIKLSNDRIMAAFVDKMIADKGDDLDEKQKGRLRRRLMVELDNAIGKAMVMALSDEQAMELDKMLNSEVSDGEIERFFAGAGIDYDYVVHQAMGNFRVAYMTGKLAPADETGAGEEA